MSRSSSHRDAAKNRGVFASLWLIASLFGAFALPTRAFAGGFFLHDRGTRATGRAGAFVAGVDDPMSLWYNPAGLAWSGHQLLVDLTYTRLDASFTRIDSGGNWQPTVQADPLPIPPVQLAYTNNFGLDDFGFAVGLGSPTAHALVYPRTLGDLPAPQRYSLVSMDGSLLVSIGGGIAWRPIPELSIGLTFAAVYGSFASTTFTSACDHVVCTQPENPEYDAFVELELRNILSPSGVVGITYANDWLRIGASVLFPYSLSGRGTLDVVLPAAEIFDGATIDGDQADVTFDFPMSIRAGVEVRPFPDLRVEAATVIELWAVQEEIKVVPRDVWIRDVIGVGDYEMGPMSIPRHMKNTYSLRLGGEYNLAAHRPLTLRAGASWEPSAFPDEYLSPMTIDGDKLMATFGATYEFSTGVMVDFAYAHLFIGDKEIRNSQVPQPNPIRPPPDEDAMGTDAMTYIGNGNYAMDADMFGLALRWKFDARAQDEVASQ